MLDAEISLLGPAWNLRTLNPSPIRMRYIGAPYVLVPCFAGGPPDSI